MAFTVQSSIGRNFSGEEVKPLEESGEEVKPLEETELPESIGQESKTSAVLSEFIDQLIEREEIGPLPKGKVATVDVDGPKKSEEVKNNKSKRHSFTLDIEKVRAVTFAQLPMIPSPVSSPKELPSQAGSDKEASPKLYPPIRKTSSGTPHSGSSGTSPRTLQRRRESPKRVDVIHGKAQVILTPKSGGDQSLSRRDSPKDRDSPRAFLNSSPEERKKRSLSSESKVKCNISPSLVLTSSSESGAPLDEHSPQQKKGSNGEDVYLFEPNSPHEEKRKRAISAEQRTPKRMTGPLKMVTQSEPTEPVSLRELAGKTKKVKEGIPILDLKAMKGRSLEDLKAEEEPLGRSEKQKKYLHRASSLGELKKCEMLYSYREPSSSDSHSRETEVRSESRKRKYLPSYLKDKKVQLDEFEEISVFAGRGDFDKRAKNIMRSCIERKKESGALPIISLKSMVDLFKRICARENSLWFVQHKADLSNPHRFLLTESPRSEMLVNIFKTSGVLLTPILERLHIMKKELFNYIAFQNKRSPWATELYNILCDLTAVEKFSQSFEGVEEGIVLTKFLEILSRVLEGHTKKSIKTCVASAFGENPEEQMKVIAFLTAWSNPNMEIKAGLDGEIRDFDWLMMNKGMIPHIKHVCYETPNAPFSISTIEVGEVLRCMKQSDETPVLMNCMTINGEIFFDSSKIAFDAQPIEMFRALYREAEKNIFLRRILRTLLFHIVYTSINTKEVECKKMFYLNFKKFFSLEEGEAFLTLAMLWLDRSDMAASRLAAFLRTKGLEGEQTLSHDFFWKSFEGFWFDPFSKDALPNIYHLLAMSSWIQKQEARFMQVQVPAGKSAKIFALLRDMASMKGFYIELFAAFERAGQGKKTIQEIAEDVDVLLQVGSKKNSETVDILKKHPLPYLNVLRLTSNSCWGFADQVMRSLYPAIFIDPYFTKLKQGMDYHVDIRPAGHFEVTILRKYSAYRRIRADLVAVQGQVELAEIPFFWKVCPYQNTWKGVLKILKSFVIHPKTPAIDKQNILHQLVNYSKKNNTIFAIESAVNDEKRFSYTFDEPFNGGGSEGSS